jgi:hypothetical protein
MLLAGGTGCPAIRVGHPLRRILVKVRALCLTVCMVIASAAVAWAADVSGKWVAEVPGRQGTSESTFNFKVEGDKLTGTVTGRAGEAAISDGKIAGDDVSFSISRELRGRSFKSNYKGKIAGDEIKFTMTIAGVDRPPVEFTAKRGK